MAAQLNRMTFITLALLVVAGVVLPILDVSWRHNRYQLNGQVSKLLSPEAKALTPKLQYDTEKQAYIFNKDYKPITDHLNISGGHYTATFNTDGSKGINIVDPVSKIDMALIPQFKVLDGQSHDGRVIYPTQNHATTLVYSIQSNGVKEDIIIPRFQGSSLEFKYKLDLATGLEARLLPSGDIGVYSGESVLYGDISTGTDKDKQLLEKAKQNSAKTNLVFTIPAPIIKESAVRRPQSIAPKAVFELKSNILTLKATELKNASYPLSIDPTVSVASASSFTYKGNQDSNVDFDGTNGAITRGTLSGGSTLAWNIAGSSTNFDTNGRFGQMSVAYNGFLYVLGGKDSAGTDVQTVRVAAISTTDGRITGSWSSTTSLNATHTGGAVAAYNGFLYVVGGNNAGAGKTTVEHIAINSDGTLASAWTTDSNSLGTGVIFPGIAASNNSLYVTGGNTTTSGTATNITQMAAILGDGSVGTWANSSNTFTNNRAQHGSIAYNGYLYVVGGCNTGTCTTYQSDVWFSQIQSNGTLGIWVQGTSLSAGRSGLALTAANGYLYMTGGCSATTTNACSTFNADTQYAQIYTAGSNGPWQSGLSFTTARMWNSSGFYTTGSGTTFKAFVYAIGGCSATASQVNITCGTYLNTVQVAQINDIGMISVGANVNTTKTTTALPTAVFGHATVALNGFLYLIGGCKVNACDGEGAARHETSWATMNADGTLGAWTTDTSIFTNALHNQGEGNNSNCNDSSGFGGQNDFCGLGGVNATTHDGYIYVFGGYDGNAWSNKVYYQLPNATTGAIGAWTEDADNLPDSSGQRGVFPYKGYLYTVGGCQGTAGIGCSTYYATVSRSLIGASGNPGAWSATSLAQLPVATGLGGFAQAGNFVYYIGGSDGSNAQKATTYYAALASDGTIASWSTLTANLEEPTRRLAATSMNGYIYVFGGHNASGQNTGSENNGICKTNTTGSSATYNCVYSGKINMATGDIASWTLLGETNLAAGTAYGAVLSSTRWNLSATAGNNGFIYVAGGCNTGAPPASCTARATTTDYMQISNGGPGSLATWSTDATGPLAAARYLVGSVISNGYVYTIGGCTSINCGSNSQVATVEAAQLDSNGSLKAFAAVTALPAKRAQAAVTAYNGFIYVSGGIDGTGAYNNQVYYTKTTTGGTLTDPGCGSTWCTVSGGSSFTTNRYGAFSVAYNGFLYVGGGCNTGGCSTYQSDIQYASINSTNGSLGSFSATTSLPAGAGVHASAAVAYNGILYISGGYNTSSVATNTVMSNTFSGGGGVSGTWTTEGSAFTNGRATHSMAAYDGFMYVIGGGYSGSSQSNTQMAPILSSGRIGQWQQVQGLPGLRDSTQAAIGNGYIYLVGGNNSGTLQTSTFYTPMLSIHHSGIYSRFADTDLDTTPRNIVYRGTRQLAPDSQITINYQNVTSTSSPLSWSTLNTILYTIPEGVNTIAATSDGLDRYYWFQIVLDDSMTATFPDSTTPTTLTDFDFYYSAASAKRLRNGKTFTNETQTNLDAHP